VTRNTEGFVAAGVRVLNPFETTEGEATTG